MKKFPFIAILFSTILSACVKDGEIGPQGPVGPTGPTGPGIIVSDGTASITTWNYDANNNDWYNTITDANITDITSDVVNVYLVQTDNSGTYLSGLPVSTSTGSINYFVYNGSVEIDVANGSSTVPPATLEFDIAVISPDVVQAHPGVKFTNIPYSLLKQTLTASELIRAMSAKLTVAQKQ